MRVFFTAATTSAPSKRLERYQRLCRMIEELDHELTNYYFLDDSNPEKKLAYSKLENKKENVFSITTKAIKSSNCLIADVTFPSITIGLQIEFAISNKIPVLCLYDKDQKDELPLVIRDYKNNLLTRRMYSDDTDVKFLLEDYFDGYKKGRIKFNFFLGYDLDRYLNMLAEKEHKAKSEIVREILMKSMLEDPSAENLLSDPNAFAKYSIPSKVI